MALFNLFRKNSGEFGKDPGELLKEATSKKKQGDINGAIDTLRSAYKAIGKGSTNYPVSAFLRLPQYLQQAGRNDEAWKEFNLLLIDGYPNQIGTHEIIPMDHCSIYDKMRLFLQREKKPRQAIKFGVLSYFSWAVGLSNQKRKKELRSFLTEENTEKMLLPLLKKAKLTKKKDEILKVLLTEKSKFPNIKMGEIGEKIDQIVSKQ